jgi:hypothetical protein
MQSHSNQNGTLAGHHNQPAGPATRKDNMIEKDKDPFGFHKAINWEKLNDPKVLKELEEHFKQEEKENEEEN